MNKNLLLLSSHDLDKMFGQVRQPHNLSHAGGNGGEENPALSTRQNILTNDALDELLGTKTRSVRQELPPPVQPEFKPEEFSATSPDLEPFGAQRELVEPEQFSATSPEPPTGLFGDASSMPSTNSLLVYHIILDSEFYVRHKMTQNGQVFGKLRHSIGKEKIPVLFSEDEGERVANRLIDEVEKMGTIGNKIYPVAGAIILGLRLNGVTKTESTADSGTGSRDYNKLTGDGELLMYKVSGTERGVLDKKVFESGKAFVVSAKYIVKTTLDKRMIFALHNVNPNLGKDDIELLKKLYDVQGKTIQLQRQDGGNSTDPYYALYRAEKKKYLELKRAI